MPFVEARRTVLLCTVTELAVMRTAMPLNGESLTTLVETETPAASPPTKIAVPWELSSPGTVSPVVFWSTWTLVPWNTAANDPLSTPEFVVILRSLTVTAV